MLTVVLTGGLASGKSTVGRWLRELGCTVTDSDRLVAELYEPGRPGNLAVSELFGNDVLDDRGGVDKKKLADRVFGAPEQLERLEQAIHPLVGLAWRELVERSDGIVVFEVPLLRDERGASAYDVVVTVEADSELRFERAVARGVEPESARQRLALQADSETRIALADHVLRNDGTLEELRDQVEALVDELRRREREAGA